MNGNSKLSEALKYGPPILEYVIGLNPHGFERLRNPMMQKVMPPRITLKRIAAMVKMPLQDLLDKLNEMAGLPPERVDESPGPPQSPEERPTWMNDVNLEKMFWVDVLAGDERLDDPMPPINIAVNGLKPGQTIGVKHKWEPQPLFDIWHLRGFDFWSEQQGPDLWHIFVHKPLE